MNKIVKIFRFIKKILVRRNLLQFANIHNLYLNSQQSKLNNMNYLVSKYSTLNTSKKIDYEEYQVFSQNGEDGVLLDLLSRMNIEKRKCLEIGAGGLSSNVLNLNLNFGFECVFIDGDSKALDINKTNRNNFIHRFKNNGPSQYIEKIVQPENIKELDKKLNFKDFAICSIDIDGADYFIFEKILEYDIPIIIVEYNSLFGTDNKFSVPFDESFSRYKYHKSHLVFGCSLDALDFIAKPKGYSLVYCESNGVNAFFVKNSLLSDSIKNLTVQEAFKENYKLAHLVPKNFLEDVKRLLIKVDEI